MPWTPEEKVQIREAAKQASAGVAIIVSAVEQILDDVIEDPTILEKYAKVVKIGMAKFEDEGFSRADAIAILTSMLSKLGSAGK